MFDGEVSMDQLEQELAEYAESQQKARSRWTDDHDRLLLKARDDYGMTWDALSVWWKAQFGWGSDKALNARYKQLKANTNG